MVEERRAQSPTGAPPEGRGRGALPLLPARGLLERRWVVLAVAGLAYAGVVALQRTVADPADALSLLYVVPVALIALELGFVAGLCAALGATGLTVTWWVGGGSRFDPVAVLTWTVAFVAVGGTTGWFSDRMRTAHHRQRLLLQSGLTLTRLGSEEHLAAALAEQASRLLGAEDVRVEQTADELPAAPSHRDEHRVPLHAGEEDYGTLVFRRSKPLTADDQTAVSILALQAAVAAENARLLVSERERAVVRAQLSDTRLRLDDRSAQLRELINRVEAERAHVAYELHEEAAQMLAAALLRLAALSQQLDSESVDDSLQQLRVDLGSTMRSLRSLAVDLKPSALELGLTAALQELVGGRAGDGSSTVSLDGVDELDPEASLLVFRAVEEALQAVPVADSLALRTQERGREMAVEIHAPVGVIESERLAILRARVDLLAGQMDSSDRHLRVVLPLWQLGERASNSLKSAPAQPSPGSAAAPEPG